MPRMEDWLLEIDGFLFTEEVEWEVLNILKLQFGVKMKFNYHAAIKVNGRMQLDFSFKTNRWENVTQLDSYSRIPAYVIWKLNPQKVNHSWLTQNRQLKKCQTESVKLNGNSLRLSGSSFQGSARNWKCVTYAKLTFEIFVLPFVPNVSKSKQMNQFELTNITMWCKLKQVICTDLQPVTNLCVFMDTVTYTHAHTKPVGSSWSWYSWEHETIMRWWGTQRLEQNLCYRRQN